MMNWTVTLQTGKRVKVTAPDVYKATAIAEKKHKLIALKTERDEE